MNREVLDRWCERGILALVLAILVFGSLALGAVGTRDFLIIQGLTLGVIALWVARLWLAERPKLLWPPVCWAVLAFALYAIGRYWTARIEYVARQELIHVLVYAFLFLAIVNNLHRQESTQIISFTLIFLAMGISFYAIYQFLTGSNHVWNSIKPYEHRGSGTFISPNHLGGFLEMLLPLGLAFALAGRLKPVMKILLGYASLVILAGIAVTVSRGSWISTVLSLMIFFAVLLRFQHYRLPALGLLILLVGSGLYFLPKSHFLQARTRNLMANGKVDDDVRFSLWLPAIEIWRENIWWGAGPAHFDYRFRQYRPAHVQRQPEYVHNDFLNTLTDWGIVGAILVTAALGLGAVGVAKTWRFVRGTPSDLGSGKSSNKFAFVLGASIGLTAIGFHSVVDFNMHIPANAILAVTLLALLSSHLRFASEKYWFTASLGIKSLATALAVAGLAYLGAQGWRHASEFAWLERAGKAPIFSTPEVDLLRKAALADPMNAETASTIGEALRTQSLEGADDYRNLAEEAMEWFKRGTDLNPWDGYNFLHYGMCLDWLGRQGESAAWFDRAEQLDPNGYFTLANIGVHYVESGDYAAATPWFERSLHLQGENNPIAMNYLKIAHWRLMEAATNKVNSPLDLRAP